ncbi:MAG: hotdog fold thioesterase [Tannerellaceae bacterium]|jgi:acyl-CoA thioesterase|nr:hotdog fold thioesterase [Tannerellaceae bacterium]
METNIAAIHEFFKGDKFALAAGVELLEVGHGYAKTRMTIRPEHLNGGGVCQGGAIFTLADLAFAAAVNSHARLTYSISSSISFFRSESQGSLYAEAREIFDHKRLSNCEVRVTNDAGDLVATFVGTGYRKDIPLPFQAL